MAMISMRLCFVTADSIQSHTFRSSLWRSVHFLYWVNNKTKPNEIKHFCYFFFNHLSIFFANFWKVDSFSAQQERAKKKTTKMNPGLNGYWTSPDLSMQNPELLAVVQILNEGVNLKRRRTTADMMPSASF